MDVIQGLNVNDLYVEGLWRLKVSGKEEESRNGKVMVLPGPAMSIYMHPDQRVLTNPERDANPFFHLMESIWMLAGRRDVQFLEHYNKRMREFSDDESTFNGAYGHRWREYFDADQLIAAIQTLQRDPTTRRVVIGMWDPQYDLGSTSKDIPCNTHIYFRSRNGGFLDMTVCCRSNDAVWGAYGANAVHFSVLQEFIARAVGLQVGTMYQLSNNFHIYEHHWPLLKCPVMESNPYLGRGSARVVPLFQKPSEWVPFLDDCEEMTIGIYPTYKTYFFNAIIRNAMMAYYAFRNKDFNAALSCVAAMPMCDWRIAMDSWLIRRMPKGAHDVPESK